MQEGGKLHQYLRSSARRLAGGAEIIRGSHRNSKKKDFFGIVQKGETRYGKASSRIGERREQFRILQQKKIHLAVPRAGQEQTWEEQKRALLSLKN